ncbi:2-amino-3-ketobutyrate coenzyme A ligase, mitochondrial, partial [Gryllus bimaculatus]
THTLPSCIPSRSNSQARGQICALLRNELKSIKEAGTWKSEYFIKSPQGVKISVEPNREVLNFCANNYLGLSSHPAVVKAAQVAIENYGAGLSSVRFICGTQELENKIAKFHDREDAILYPSCFDANAALFEVVLSNEDAVFSDELNHASIIDGIRLCRAKKIRYSHRHMKDLEEKLISTDARIKLIATDGVFSMDGNVAPLPEILNLARKYNAITFVDDCHATGFFGKSGRGTEEFFEMLGAVDIINSTLGKAVGGASGGYTTGPKEVIELLRQRGRPYLFSNALPPPVVAAGIKALDIIQNDKSFVTNIQKNTKMFRLMMTKLGFTIAGENHPICPVMLGDARLANTFASEMLEEGIYVIGFSYPVVPKNKARIRVQISAAHSEDDIHCAVNAFSKIGKKLNVIP